MKYCFSSNDIYDSEIQKNKLFPFDRINLAESKTDIITKLLDLKKKEKDSLTLIDIKINSEEREPINEDSYVEDPTQSKISKISKISKTTKIIKNVKINDNISISIDTNNNNINNNINNMKNQNKKSNEKLPKIIHKRNSVIIGENKNLNSKIMNSNQSLLKILDKKNQSSTLLSEKVLTKFSSPFNLKTGSSKILFENDSIKSINQSSMSSSKETNKINDQNKYNSRSSKLLLTELESSEINENNFEIPNIMENNKNNEKILTRNQNKIFPNSSSLLNINSINLNDNINSPKKTGLSTLLTRINDNNVQKKFFSSIKNSYSKIFNDNLTTNITSNNKLLKSPQFCRNINQNKNYNTIRPLSLFSEDQDLTEETKYPFSQQLKKNLTSFFKNKKKKIQMMIHDSVEEIALKSKKEINKNKEKIFINQQNIDHMKKKCNYLLKIVDDRMNYEILGDMDKFIKDELKFPFVTREHYVDKVFKDANKKYDEQLNKGIIKNNYKIRSDFRKKYTRIVNDLLNKNVEKGTRTLKLLDKYLEKAGKYNEKIVIMKPKESMNDYINKIIHESKKKENEKEKEKEKDKGRNKIKKNDKNKKEIKKNEKVNEKTEESDEDNEDNEDDEDDEEEKNNK